MFILKLLYINLMLLFLDKWINSVIDLEKFNESIIG